MKMSVANLGTIRVSENDSRLLKSGGGFAAITIDLDSKYACCSGYSTSDNNGPTIFLDSDENTLHTNKVSEGQIETTLLTFPEYKGWNVFNCDVSRYTVLLTLIDSF